MVPTKIYSFRKPWEIFTLPISDDFLKTDTQRGRPQSLRPPPREATVCLPRAPRGSASILPTVPGPSPCSDMCVLHGPRPNTCVSQVLKRKTQKTNNISSKEILFKTNLSESLSDSFSRNSMTVSKNKIQKKVSLTT